MLGKTPGLHVSRCNEVGASLTPVRSEACKCLHVVMVKPSSIECGLIGIEIFFMATYSLKIFKTS